MEKTPFPLHPAQKDVFIDQLLNIESPHYNIGGYIRLAGTLDKEKFLQAVSAAPRVFDAYKMRFNSDISNPSFNLDAEYESLELDELDFSKEHNAKEVAHRWMQERFNTPFTINENNLLFDHVLIKVEDREHWFFCRYHHLITDGYGFTVWVQYLASQYKSLVTGDNFSGSYPSYVDEVLKALEIYRSPEYELEGEYWKEKIGSKPPKLLQKKYFNNSSGSRSSTFILEVTDDQKKIFEDLQLLTRVSIQQLTIAALIVYFGKTTNETDFVFGIPLHKRGSKRLRSIIGMFSGIQPFKGSYNEDDILLELLKEISQIQRKDYRYQNYLIGDLTRNFPNSDFEEGYLTQIVVNYEPLNFENDFGETVDATVLRLANEYEVTPLQIVWRDYGKNRPLQLHLHYKNEYFNNEEISLLAERIIFILEQFPAKLNFKLSTLNTIPEAEYQLLTSFNSSSSGYPSDKTIVDLFEEQVTKTPEAVAVVFEGGQLSYQQLNERANQLAFHLRTKGVKEETCVPICIERSFELIVGILGILKAGGAYVPIDFEYPAERIKFMLKDVSATLLITSKESKQRLPPVDNVEVIEIDTDFLNFNHQPTNNLRTATKASSLAYIIYTSGSSGTPKGVMVEHANVVSLVKDVEYVSSTSNDILLSTGSPSFDATTFEYWSMLLNGGQLVLSTENILLDIQLLKNEITSRKVTKMWFTSSWFNQLVETDITVFASLKTILVGGEKLSEKHIEKVREKYEALTIVNGYGPTENTTFSLLYNIRETQLNNSIPIGRPLNNRTAYIVAKEQLVPVGVPGEILLGGAGLSRGYLNRPELTAEKFIEKSFNGEWTQRLYKTGDLGRWLPDGNIEYLGRLDEQVKIRGYRIELGEIESVLLQGELVSQAVVITKEDNNGTKRLVGYVVPNGSFDKQAIITYLEERLPEYMVPALWVQLNSLPLTANGKIDKQALPEPDVDKLSSNEYVAPTTELEKLLAEIWQQLLGLDRVGIEDNLFELGADSILTIQVVSRANRLGYQLQPKDIFLHQTIARLSRVIAERTTSAGITEQGELTGLVGLLPIQQWYLDKQSSNLSHFNQSVLLSIDKLVAKDVCEEAIEQLASYHDALRFRFYKKDGQWQQEYSSFKGSFTVENLAEVDGSIDQIIFERAQEYQKSLDIEKGQLLQAVLIQTPETELANKLLVIIHHLAVDGVSWRILLEDLELLVSQLSARQKVDLGGKGTSYRQWYNKLRQYGQSEQLLSQKGYWQQVSSSFQPIRTDKNYNGLVRVKDIKNYQVRLAAEQTQILLQHVPRVYHTEINDILLASLAQTLCAFSSTDKVVIGLEGHGREDIGEGVDVSRTVGWFTNLYPVLLEVGSAGNNDELIKTIKEQLRQVPDRGLGYGVLRYINKEDTLQNIESWDVVFNYLGQLDNVARSSQWIKVADEGAGASRSEDLVIDEKITVDGSVQSGELILNWNYSSKHFNEETIKAVASDYVANLIALIAHCVEQEKLVGSISTPSDYGLGSEIRFRELDKFLNETQEGKKRREQIEGLYLLNGLQQGLLFHSLYSKEVEAYIEQFACDLINPNIGFVIKSWQFVLRNHTILRSAFYSDAFDVPVQCVFKEVELPVEILDLRRLADEEQVVAINNYKAADRKKGFDFKNPPLLRLAFVQLSDNRYNMICTLHHIVVDGWSLPIIVEELLRTYEELANHREVIINNEDKFEDYIRYLESRDISEEEAYWRNYIHEIDRSTMLPFISPTADRNSGIGEFKIEYLKIDAATTLKVQSFAKHYRLTTNTLMQGVWFHLLHHYSGNDKVTFGITVSGRPNDLPNIEKRVGMFINTIPLKSVRQEGQNLVKWLQSLQQDQVLSRQYQYAPLHNIQSWSSVQGDLFDTLFVFENYPLSKAALSNNWQLKLENVHANGQTNYPLSIQISGTDEIRIGFGYNSDLLDTVYVKEIMDHFQHVLLQFTEINEESKLDDIRILTPTEEQRLLIEFNSTAVEYPDNKTVVELFEQQVLQTPGNTALIFNDTRITYSELNARANKLARYLRNKGVKEETLVPLCIDRGVEMVVGILGILKAGGAYVPIDTEYPLDRISYMLQDSAADFAITNSTAKSKIKLKESGLLVDLDEDWVMIESEVSDNLHLNIGVNNLVYIIYTSGSTGRPKGVQVEHKGLVSLSHNQIQVLGLEPGKKVLQFASFGFDASCSEIFTTLLSGSTLIIPRRQDLLSTEAIVNLIDTHSIDVATLPPSYQALIKENLQNIPAVISAGERLNPTIAGELQSFGVRLFNAYGPTENTVCVTMTDNPVLPDGTVTIGKPIGNVKVYIVDEQLHLVPIGVPGELCVGGVQVARGYLNRPELTAEKFIKNPFSTGEDRIYRTGDIALWLPDGNIEYLGRLDEQIKVAGHRIECGEIESVLRTNELIEDAVVALNEKEGNQRLAAFYKPKKRIELWPSIAEFFIYDDIVYRSMYEHTSRNDKYRAALEKVVKDKTVLEIGPGPEAVLSRLCLDTGAKHVYAVEILEETYLKAKRCIEALGLTDKITLIHGDIRDVVLPEKVDYCVSEIVGSIGGSEGSAVLIDLAKKFLKDPSNMIPGRSTTKIAALTLDDTSFEYGFSDIAYQYVEKIEDTLGEDFEFRLCLKNMPKQNIISSEDIFEDLDYRNNLDYNLTHDITLSINKKSVFNGFVVWMDLHLDEQNHLDIIEDPGSWLPIYFPISYPGITVYEGDVIKAKITRKLSSNNLNPDFFIDGALTKADGSTFEFDFASYHHQVPKTKSKFFRKLFEDGKARRLTKLDTQYLREYLGSFLPQYMIPTAFIPLESIPLTPNGKVDRKALPDPDGNELLSSEYEAPQSETEEKLTKIWQEILELDHVGIKNDFFDLGGHSLLAIRLVSLINKTFDIDIKIGDVFEHPTIESLAGFLETPLQTTALPVLKVQERPLHIPLSYGQERLWFIDQLEGSVQYHSPGVIHLKGNLNRKALQHAFQTLIERHEVLRTIFLEQEGHPYQFIKVDNQWKLNVIDGSNFRNNEEGLQEYIQHLISIPFDLRKDEMLRANLVELSEQEHVLVVVTHHIASDAWSLPIIVKEVAELYASFAENRDAKLPPLQLQYADFAIWQRGYLQGEILQNRLAYWKNKLDGLTPLQLPLDYTRPAIKSNRGVSAAFEISKELATRLNQLSRQHGATLYMTLLSAFNIMLNRYSGQSDISVGGSVANRSQQEIEGLVGFFVNTLAYRTEIDSSLSFAELLQQVRTTTLEAYEHQEVPFEKVVEVVAVDRDPSISPLFQVMLVLVNTPEVPELKLGDVVLSPGTYKQATVKFDITFFVTETADGLQGLVEYSTDLFKPETISRMTAHFTNLLSAVVKNPLQKVGLLPMLAEAEQQQLLSLNNIEVAYPKDQTIVSLFEEQALKTPQATAVVYDGEELSYEQLNAKANQLAHYLRQRGVKEDTLVPVYIERSHHLMVGILGIMKAGAAYVPIDTDFPADRISYMIKDSGSPIVVSSKESRAKLETAEPDTDIIVIDGTAFSNQPTTNPQTALAPHHLAYVIYTSGSTGMPKGVMIEHRSLVDYVFGLNQQIQVDQCASYALVSSIATDLGNTVIYSSLVFGGALHLFSKEAVSNIEYLHRYFQANQIDCLKIVPSHWKALSLDEELLLPKKLLVFGGEALQSELVENIRQSGSKCTVVNHYGPTETTIGKLLHVTEQNKTYNNTIPIGKPFSNTAVYVLSKDLQLTPQGVPGQLYIAGDGVARGYLNNEELTKAKFIKNPYSKEATSLMYGTGDLVKYLPDGNIEFIGRVDDQVKIRGYRVELGEIESILQQSELVSQGVVLAKEDKQGNKRLVGYVVAEDGWFDREGILSYLKEKLPEYMVPSMLVELESLPLTANGKVDRKALPDPEAAEQTGDKYVAPRNDAEARLTEIWQDVLEEEKIGVNDNFFELGGHSLLAVRLISAIRKEFAVEIPISHVFDYPTIASLAAELDVKSDTVVLPSIEAIHPRPERIPLSFSQERLWFIDKLEGSVQYHVPAVLRLKGDLNAAALEQALKTIVNRHEILRTVILEKEGQPYQHVKKGDQWQLTFEDGGQYKHDQEGLKKYAEEIINKPFDLSADDMIRAHLITIDQHHYVLVVTLHHIASDGWSRSILVRELVKLYKDYHSKYSASLLPLPLQFADYAIWQRNYLNDQVLDEKLSYWKNKLEGVTALQLPTDFARPAVQSTRGAIEVLHVGKDLNTNLQHLSQQHGATLFMTLMAAFKVLLHRYTGQEDICIGGGIAGRAQQEVEQLIGFFVNMLAFRSNVSSDLLFSDLLKQIKETTLEAYAHQEVPFEKVVDTIGSERDLSRNPLFQVTFILQNTPEVPKLQLGDLELSLEHSDHNSAKFDLTFSITETDSELEVLVEYATDLFTRDTIIKMLGHYNELLNAVVKEPGQKVSALKMLTDAEEQQILIEFNNNQLNYDRDKSIIDLFQEQVLKTPGNTAVTYNDYHLTYDQLNERSNQLAHYLVSEGVKRETLVAICIERSLEMIVAILGILKAGGAYVPIDPTYPEERIKYIIKDSQAAVVVINTGQLEKLQVPDAVNIIEIGGKLSEIATLPTHNLSATPQPSDLAYVIYTSGSTGKPKGAMIEHGSVINLIHAQTSEFKIDSDERILLFSNYSFDASVEQMFLALFNGASLFLFTEGLQLETLLFQNFLKEKKITHLHATPSFLTGIDPRSQSTLKRVIAGGDLCKKELADKWKDTVQFYNEYGPTETTVTTIEYLASIDKDARISNLPIGKPIANVSIYILDKENNICPIGIPGELYIGGVQVCRGYLNRANLTAAKFVTNQFDKSGNSRLYKTGDFARWLQDGNIEFLGRIDDQVKIRGYRIEIGEIENVLEECSLVNESVVIAKPEDENNLKLISYYVPDNKVIKAKEQDLYEKQVATWNTLYNTEYLTTKADEGVDPEFDIIGWTDSFTGLPIAEEQMQSWLKDIVDVIFAEKPENVLEIGCGTGLIYYQLAGKVKKYIGTDFSRSSINQIESWISKGLRDYGNTELHVCAAHEVRLNDEEPIDTIIINSVIQYFPGQDYMTSVIENCIKILKGKGRIVVGDVRDYRLLELFKERLSISKFQHSVSIKEFNWAVQQDVLKEEELCFSPDYFYNLQSVFPEISHVNIQWKNSSYSNELSLYRYTVEIHVGEQPEIIEPEWQNWNELSGFESVTKKLELGKRIVALQDVPNQRLWKERILSAAIAEKKVNLVGDLLQMIKTEDSESTAVNDLINYAEDKGYRYKLLLDEDIFKVNLILEKEGSNKLIQQHYKKKDSSETKGNFTNIPLFTDIASLLQKEIRVMLQQSLPAYMIPSDFIAVSHLPVTNNGKVDRSFLAQREERGIINKQNYQPPVTEVEKILADIWKELLSVERIGIHDNFFELGGHSLLAIRVIAAIRDRWEIELLVRDIFEYANIFELAKYVEIQMNVYSLEDDTAEFDIVTL